jgi:uncharacterized protein (DUF305 family)
MRRWMIAAMVVIALQSAKADDTVPTFAAGMERAMERMHADMAASASTGDPKIDFLRMMIPHHQGAVDMAALLLRHTQDPRLRNLAQSIITEQRYEIQLMEQMLTQSATEQNR